MTEFQKQVNNGFLKKHSSQVFKIILRGHEFAGVITSGLPAIFRLTLEKRMEVLN